MERKAAGVDPWDPDRYRRFRGPRERPLHDLAAMVVARPDMTVLDLGCGTGEGTAWMHHSLGAAATVGVDLSSAMLGEAAAHAVDGLRFVEADLSRYEPDAPVDLVFSNAALHWLEDHPALLARLVGLLARGGQLAVQVPANHEHPSQTVAAEVAREAPFAGLLDGYVRASPVLSPVAYTELLHALGLEDVRVRLEVYLHVLDSWDDVVEWVRGTTLTDYQRRMPADAWPAFLERYRAALARVLPDERPFPFAFQRILMAGRKGAEA